MISKEDFVWLVMMIFELVSEVFFECWNDCMEEEELINEGEDMFAYMLLGLSPVVLEATPCQLCSRSKKHGLV